MPRRPSKRVRRTWVLVDNGFTDNPTSHCVCTFDNYAMARREALGYVLKMRVADERVEAREEPLEQYVEYTVGARHFELYRVRHNRGWRALLGLD